MKMMGRMMLLQAHKVSREDGYPLIKFSESAGGRPQLVSYKCSASTNTIGWGHTKGVNAGDVCTEAEAEAFFAQDIADCEAAIERNVTRTLTQYQTDALASWIFNFGETNLQNWNLLGLINSGAPDGVIVAKWNKYLYSVRDDDGDGDKDAPIDRGLLIRRYRESLMWMGYSWRVCEAAAAANNVKLVTIKKPWLDKGGWKEYPAKGSTMFEEVLERALGLAAFFEEPDHLNPEGDDDLFEDLSAPDVVAPAPHIIVSEKEKPADPDLEQAESRIWWRVLAREAEAKERARRSRPVAREKEADVEKTVKVAKDPGAAQKRPPSPNSVPVDQVPYKVDPSLGYKDMTESDRFWGTFFMALGHGLRVAAARVTVLAPFSVVYTETLSNPAVIAMASGAAAWGSAVVVEKLGVRKKRKGEERASQPIY